MNLHFSEFIIPMVEHYILHKTYFLSGNQNYKFFRSLRCAEIPFFKLQEHWEK